MISPIKKNSIPTKTKLEQYQQNKSYAESSWVIVTTDGVKHFWNGKLNEHKKSYRYNDNTILKELIRETEFHSKPIYIKHSSCIGIISNDRVSRLILLTDYTNPKALVRYQFKHY